MPFGVVDLVGPGNDVLDGCAHWRHLTNMVEQLYMAAIHVSGSGKAAIPRLLWATCLCCVDLPFNTVLLLAYSH